MASAALPTSDTLLGIRVPDPQDRLKYREQEVPGRGTTVGCRPVPMLGQHMIHATITVFEKDEPADEKN